MRFKLPRDESQVDIDEITELFEFPDDTGSMLQNALWWARNDVPVFPCNEKKEPIIPKGHLSATTNPKTIKDWWAKYPDAMIGGVCHDALAIVDIDNKIDKDGLSGFDHSDRLVEENGNWGYGMRIRTPSGGVHLYCKGSSLPFAKSEGRIAPHIDTRCSLPNGRSGGYVILPPSFNDDGQYGLESRKKSVLTLADLPDAPHWVAAHACFNAEERKTIADEGLDELLQNTPRVEWRATFDRVRQLEANARKAAHELSGFTKGGGRDLFLDHPFFKTAIKRTADAIRRADTPGQQNPELNATCFYLGKTLGNLKLTLKDLEDAGVVGELEEAASEMRDFEGSYSWKSAKGRTKAAGTIRSGLTAGLLKPRDLSHVNSGGAAENSNHAGKDSSGKAKPERLLKAERLDRLETEIEPMEWLWLDYLPLGKMTNIVGPPKVGKSQIAALIAAHVTTGKPWPWTRRGCKEREPASVVFMSAEDMGDVLVPRLRLAGADLSKVTRLTVQVKYDEDGGYAENLVSITEDAAKLDSEMVKIGDVKLIILDPVMAYVGRGDTHKNSDVRRELAPILAIAEKHRAALLCVTHRNKSIKDIGDPLDAITGSGAFGQAARGNIFVGFNEKDDKRYFKPHGSNYAPADTPAIEFRIENGFYLRPEGRGKPPTKFEASYAVWGQVSDDVDTFDLLKASGIKPRKPTEQIKAAIWLKDQLKNGKPVEYEAIMRLGDAAGFSKRTLQRAAHNDLKITVVEPERVGGKHLWKLTHKAATEFEDWLSS